MEMKKRELLPYEKVLFGLKVFVACVSSIFLVLYCVYHSSWAIAAAWMCICVAQIAGCFVRWEEQTKMKIISICAFGTFFVLFGYLLVQSLV